MSEQQLIKDCQNGIKSSQYLLVKRYGGLLMSVARRYVNDEDNAKDVLQEALIRIFKHIDTYQKTGSFEGWMRKITINCALQHLKKYHQTKIIEINDYTTETSILPNIFQKLEVETVIQFTQKLPVGFRTVFNLSLIEGYNHKEISQLLGITESTSRSQLARAKKLFKELWEKERFNTQQQLLK